MYAARLVEVGTEKKKKPIRSHDCVSNLHCDTRGIKSLNDKNVFLFHSEQVLLQMFQRKEIFITRKLIVALTHPGKFYISELNISLTKSLKGNKSQFLSAFIQESRLLEAIVESAR